VRSLGFREDCLSHDPNDIEVREDRSGWLLTDGRSRMLLFDEQADAEKARTIVRSYGFDQRCFVGRPDPPMQYWLVGGGSASITDARIRSEDCIRFDRSNLEIREDRSGWLLVDGRSRMLLFDEQANAERARAIIRHYGFDYQCFVGRPGPPMRYWVSD
jgi:hypothetical protein